ncbi:MAG TPA: DedA family protein [Candidatus Baltobacteraceae bacterium]|jgi:membrane-associated protein|nr:DedA family protein [Candidatus Baltobacteraceae bacterium]
MREFIDLFLHLDVALGSAIAAYGGWIYAFLFAVIFCETGLVVTPFLPGDSLIFAAGAFAASGALNVWIVAGLLFAAAALGDTVNYRIGRKIGANAADGRLLGLPIKKEYLEKTKRYYGKYGAKTIVLARFVPIIRTFAPFVAGVGAMPYATFARYNILGAALWVGLFAFAGYFFGNIPAVKGNFEFVILGIIAVSLLPAVIGYLRERKKG